MSSSLGQDLLVTLPLLYAIPSIMAYIFVFFIILRYFRTTFYILFFINGISEVLLWLTGYVKYRGTSAPIYFGFYRVLPTEGPLITIVFFINYVVPFSAKCTNFLLTLNRYTLIKFSAKRHNKIWYYLLPTSVTASFVLAMGLNVPILVSGAWANVPAKGQEFYSYESDPGVEYRQSLYSVASIITLGTGTLVLNASVAISLWRHRKEHSKAANGQTTAQDSMREAEAKLCIMTFVMFLTNIVACVCQMIFFVYGGGSNMDPHMVQSVSRTQNFSEDLHILSQPWMLIAMSKAVRKKIRRAVLFQNAVSSTTLFVAPSRTRRSVVFSIQKS